MEQEKSQLKIANLSNEQQGKVRQMESEIGCVLIAYENKNKNFK